MIITTSPLVEQLIKMQDLHESPSWVILIDNIDNWTESHKVYNYSTEEWLVFWIYVKKSLIICYHTIILSLYFD